MKGGIRRSDFQTTGIDGVVALYYVPKMLFFTSCSMPGKAFIDLSI